MVSHSIRRETTKERLRVERGNLMKTQCSQARTCLLQNHSISVTSDLSGVAQRHAEGF